MCAPLGCKSGGQGVLEKQVVSTFGKTESERGVVE